MKTVLAPNAPWPSKDVKLLGTKPPSKEKPQLKLRFSAANVDYFADIHDELLQPPKRGRGNPNAAKNFEKFNLRFL